MPFRLPVGCGVAAWSPCLILGVERAGGHLAPEVLGLVKTAEPFSGSGIDAKIGSMFMSNAKSFLTSAKQLMRRVRDYNQLVDSYNRGARI